MHHEYRTHMTCSSKILFDLNDDVVTNVKFIGGCDGNLKAIAKLIDGWRVDQITEKLSGNTCNGRPTSCADQLAIAVAQAYAEENQK